MKNENVNIEKGDKTETSNKKIKLFIILIILVILFALYGVNRNKVEPLSREEQIIVYLKEKYPESDFEIEKLVDSKQAMTSGVSCDGTDFIKPKDIEGKFEYYYDMISKLDNIKFNLYLIDDNGKLEISDSYDTCRNMKDYVGKIQDYIISIIGDENSKKSSYYKVGNYSLHYSCDINVYLNENFKDILNEDFINKLYLINKYEEEITADYNNVCFSIFIHDNTGNYINVSRYVSLNGFYVYDKNGQCLGELNEYYSGKQIINIR